MNHPITRVHWDDRHTEAASGYNEYHCDRKEPICQTFCGLYEMAARRVPGAAEIYNQTARRQGLLDDSILKSSSAFWRIPDYHNDYGSYRLQCTDVNIKGDGLMVPSPPHLAVPDVRHFPRPTCNNCQVMDATLNNVPWTVVRDAYVNKPACSTCAVKPF